MCALRHIHPRLIVAPNSRSENRPVLHSKTRRQKNGTIGESRIEQERCRQPSLGCFVALDYNVSPGGIAQLWPPDPRKRAGLVRPREGSVLINRPAVVQILAVRTEDLNRYPAVRSETGGDGFQRMELVHVRPFDRRRLKDERRL